jgi:peptide/bleomycin uptake transporter
VWRELFNFAVLVAPAVAVQPLARYVASRWGFAWRLALMKGYLAHYDADTPAVEGAAQRIHEDTARFESAIYGCCTLALDSLLTLLVFVPVLLDVGAHTRAPAATPAALRSFDGWLLLCAQAMAWAGLGVSMLVARKLVVLEVANQRVEAQLRTALVVLEQTPQKVLQQCQYEATRLGVAVGARELGTAFAPTLRVLRRNYLALFEQFAYFNTWIAAYDQAAALLPYLLIAPQLYADDPADRITLGVLMRAATAFERVFGALSVLADNWSAVNDFRATLARLREFERAVYARTPFNARRLRPLLRSAMQTAGGQPITRLHRVDRVDRVETPTPGGVVLASIVEDGDPPADHGHPPSPYAFEPGTPGTRTVRGSLGGYDDMNL